MDNKDLFINDLYLFYRYFIASDYQNSVPAPHIKTLAHELMKLMVTDEYHRLAVSMPPSALKKFNGNISISAVAHISEP